MEKKGKEIRRKEGGRKRKEGERKTRAGEDLVNYKEGEPEG